MPGPVTFLGAADTPCCGEPTFRAQFIPNVTVNGIPVSCQTHLNTPHRWIGAACKAPHTAPIALGSTRVRVMGLGLGRMFDPTVACAWVAQGIPNVIDHSL
mgnify:FL=1|jgi:uncharacterized Zn-binding protein involved in type VI secretion|tara:strand:+ start:89 stop:391 length:303 start_codon:yes stop_codon:yes gene_type:complete